MTYSKPTQSRIIQVFNDMRIKHPRLPAAHAAFNEARETGRLTPYSPQRYIEFFAPTHSGKSMAVRSYIEDVVVPEVIAKGVFPADMDRQRIAQQQRLVLHVTLSPQASVRSLAADILRQLGDKRADTGNGPVLLRRVYEYLTGEYKDPGTRETLPRQTELVILDEIQHLSVGKVQRPSGRAEKSHQIESTHVTDTLKTMLIRGLVPMVFVGIPEAREHLAIDQQLLNREMGKIDFSPLRWSNIKDQKVFLEYCLEAAELIQAENLLPETVALSDLNILHMLWAASGGCIGIASRILEEATLHAVNRDAQSIEIEDLALAVDTRALPNRMCTYNPFREGVRNVEKVEVYPA